MTALSRMLGGAIPSCVFAFISLPLFDRGDALRALPMLLMAANCAVVWLYQERLADRAAALLGRLHWAGWVAVFAAGIAFVIAATQLTGAYTFKEGDEGLYRSAYLASGEHTLATDQDGVVNVGIYSQTLEQTMMHTRTSLYTGPAEGATFTVPDKSIVTYFFFYGDAGSVLRSAKVDGREKVPLRYLLLPSNIARRLQGFLANENFVQRTVFFNDGMKLFRQSPIIGNSVGFFELGISSVQDFFYETKYVHNHFIQVLLEDGIIGFVLYVGAMIFMAIALIRSRKAALQSDFRWIYPALAAAFAMAMTHSAVELSMSRLSFLAMAYAVFALIELLFDAPIMAAARETRPEAVPKKKDKRKRIDGRMLAAKLAGGALVGVFALTLVGNLAAKAVMAQEFTSADQFLSAVKTAVMIDPYDRNSTKMSFIYGIAEERVTEYVPLANQYADDLMKVQSNALPKYLTFYYMQTSQYERAIEAAMKGAKYSVSDAEMWDQCIYLMSQIFLLPEESPLLTEGKTLIPALAAYRDIWVERNATAMEALPLSDASLHFFDVVDQLSQCADDPARIAEILRS